MVAKKHIIDLTKKTKPKKGKKTKNAKKLNLTNYLSNGTFTMAELNKYVSVLKKIRKGKTTPKRKKVGIANTVSFLNLLYNADKEKQKQPHARRNLMVTHPFNYPSMIPTNSVSALWNATKIPSSKTSDGLVNNLNNIYRTLVAYNLIDNPYGPRNNAVNKPRSLPEMPAPKEKQNDDIYEIHDISDSSDDDEDDYK